MRDGRSDLPDYERPPLVEVALSVQFEELKRLEVAHFGVLWEQFRRKFPRTERHEGLDSVVEDFQPLRVPKPGIRFQTSDRPPVPRVWFLNDRGTELIQVQRTRFVHNWRKGSTDEKYPRYEKIRREFLKNLRAFRGFLAEQDLGDLVPNQCEVTYVNHIISGQGWSSHGDVSKVLALLSMRSSDRRLGPAEDVSFTARYVKHDSSGNPIGRLHVNLRPAVSRVDDKPMYVITLTARGKPVGAGDQGVVGFLDLGRSWIVNDFTSMTTSRMHKVWGRLS